MVLNLCEWFQHLEISPEIRKWGPPEIFSNLVECPLTCCTYGWDNLTISESNRKTSWTLRQLDRLTVETGRPLVHSGWFQFRRILKMDNNKNVCTKKPFLIPIYIVHFLGWGFDGGGVGPLMSRCVSQQRTITLRITSTCSYALCMNEWPSSALTLQFRTMHAYYCQKIFPTILLEVNSSKCAIANNCPVQGH